MPDFKFNDKGGKSELARNLSNESRTKWFFPGWAHFVKLAAQNEGMFTLFPTVEIVDVAVQIVFYNRSSTEGRNVWIVEEEKEYDTRNFTHVAVLPFDSTTFKGVKTTTDFLSMVPDRSNVTEITPK